MDDQQRIAWAAGLFEGEGSISSSRERQVRLRLWMTDEDVVRRFCEIVGVGHVKGPYGPYDRGTKQLWAWDLIKKADVKKVLEMFQPWLGARRLDQILTAMQKAGWI